MDQFAAYFGYAVAALTIADRLIEAARKYAESTESKTDDEYVSRAALALDFAHQVVAVFALKGRAGK